MSTTAAPSTAAEAVRVLAGVLDALTAGLPMPQTAGERLELIAALRTVSGRVSSLTSVWVAEADRAGSAREAAGTSMTDWLARTEHADQKEAAGLLMAGRGLLESPTLQDAALGGDASPAQLRAIRQTLDELPDDLTDAQRDDAARLLVGRATEMTPRQLGRQAQRITEEIAPHLVPDREAELQKLEQQRRRAVSRRKFELVRDGDGSWLLSGSLPLVEGEKLRKLVAGYVASDRARTKGQPDNRSWSQRNADGLIALIDNHGRQGSLPGLAGDKPRVVVLINESDLRDRAEQAGVLVSGEQVDPGTLRRLCCDAEILPMVLDGNSVPVDVGRAHRTVTPEIRLALSVRDRGCAFPGCDAPDEACEAHHVGTWLAGDVTSVKTMVLVCPTHHVMVEPPRSFTGPPETRWRVRMVDGRPEFLPPERGRGRASPLADTG